MNLLRARAIVPLLLASLAVTAGCGKNPPASPNASVAKHEHHPPHGGTPVVLGHEAYHLELVLDPVAGKLSAYVLDGEMENFVRVAAPSFEIVATAAARSQPLVLLAVPNPATGETVGDTSLFEVTADCLKATPTFDAVLTKLDIRGAAFTGVPFNFPQGNDRD